MELYDRITNIYGNDITKIIRDSVEKTKEELKNLTEERMCKVYNNYLWQNLFQNHVSVRMINTIDLGFDYEHLFLLIFDVRKGFYLADLTFSQFNNISAEFESLIINGFQKIDDETFNLYLSIVTQSKNNNFKVDDVFYQLLDKNHYL